jgi:hypothetical protein
MTPSPQQEDRYETLTSARTEHTPKQGRNYLDHHPSRKTGMRVSLAQEDKYEILISARRRTDPQPQQKDRK